MGKKTKYALRTTGIAYMAVSAIIGLLEGILLSNPISMLIVIGQGLVIGGGIIAGSKTRNRGSEEIKTSDKKLFLSNINNRLFYNTENE